ncbi:MAG: DJ-1/PfpI family protein [Dehalococcoidia bacterium]|nr:DJ-1/PfpI family protein [Dehalococcoidia bacterium]
MTRSIAFVLFDGAEELDFVGPWEVFTMVNVALRDADAVRAFIVSEHGGTVRCAKGMRIESDVSFGDCPPANIVLVPGGQGTRTEATNATMLDFVRRMDAGSELTTSVCTGSFVLEAAGLLTGKRATTHWASIERLRERGTVEVDGATRFVDEGRYLTAAGVSAGIDMALHIVGRLWGPAVARLTQKAMEYFPEPPYADVPMPEFAER